MVVTRILSVAAVSWIAVGCSSGPGTFELELDPSELTMPSASVDGEGNVVIEQEEVDVLIRCGENKSRFIIAIDVEGTPDEVVVTPPPGSTGAGVNCGTTVPPATMVIDVFQAVPGTYSITLTARNFDEGDLALLDPVTVRQATLTLIITPAAGQ